VDPVQTVQTGCDVWMRTSDWLIGREFPNALEMLAHGKLHMTALRLLAPVLTASNAHLLKEACFKSKQEVRELIAKHFPLPDVVDSMRRLPQPRSTPTSQEQQLAVFSRLNSAAQLAAQLASSQQAQSEQASGAPLLAGSQQAQSVQASGSPLFAFVRSPVTVNRPGVTVPLSEGRYRVEFTASQSLHDKLKEARDLCCGEVPNGELATIVEQAVELLIAHKKKQRFALTSRPRKHWLPRSGTHASSRKRSEEHLSKEPVDVTLNGPQEEGRALAKRDENKPDVRSRAAERVLAKRDENKPDVRPCSAERVLAKRDENKPDVRSRAAERGLPQREESKPDSRYIPRALRREVYSRDGGQCSFESQSGTRCGSRRDLEFHHVVPFARGGAMTRDNLKLMCRAHNALLAERDYGRDYMKSRVAKRQIKQEATEQSHPVRSG
jgi:5-methylcytosine-specific restriction endonuclease McrA